MVSSRAGRTAQARASPATSRAPPTSRAFSTERVPSATGRQRLAGCARSSTRSRTSLRRYTALATRQNATAASSAARSTGVSSRRPAVNGAASTSTFLAHCRGRRARNVAATRCSSAREVLSEIRVTVRSVREEVACGYPRAGYRHAVLMPGRPRTAVRVLPLVVTALTAGLCGIVTAVGLHGTRWGFGSMASDAGFRTQTVTRYAETGSLVDYGYRGLPAYYPPGLPWVEGRLAHLLGVPGWTMLRPTEIVLAILIPLLAFVCWRRVLPGMPAALVVVGTTLAAAAPAKPDEWLVLAVVVPWWLEAARGVRRSELRAWPPWRHGVLLGVLLLVHTYWFLPLGLATVIG